ncbi:hypothetical protein [Bartonella sp. CB178]|uniref:hypothetical protein n=1 Tax=Bartonella sp. CB178 TaxID=3112255 RepID=UPI00300DF2FB
MVDFVRILKKTIDAQSNVTSQVRERIYKRAFETLEHQFTVATISQKVADEQRQVLQNAIAIVEEEYLAVEKEQFFSKIGWKSAGQNEDGKSTQDSVLVQNDNLPVLVTEEKWEAYVVNLKDNKESNGPSTFATPDAELVNMDSYPDSRRIEENVIEDPGFAPAVQIDSSHVVSHIFSQALRRANRSSMQKRVIVGMSAFASFIILIVCICFVGRRVFVSSHHQLSRQSVQISNASPEVFSVNRKLTQRLLEDGSEVDVGLDQTGGSLNREKASTVIAANLQPIEQLGEAVFYRARTDYDSEKVATGSVRWSLVKELQDATAQEELAIRGDITIPDEGLLLRLILRRNTDSSFPAAYVMDVIFILSDKFSGKAITDVQALTFKASEQSIGQSLRRVVPAKIDDNFFLIALSGNHPFLGRNLQLMRELNWIRLTLIDKSGRVNELTFAKGPMGESIFNEAIEQWLTRSEKSRVSNRKKVVSEGQNKTTGR